MRRSPKSVHLTNFYHPSSGGISAFYRALLAHANRGGREMCLVVPGEESGVERAGEYGRIYSVRAPRSPWVDKRYRLMLPIGSAGREIRRILRAEQPDILEVSDKYTLPFVSGMVRKNMVAGVPRPTEVATSHERMEDTVAAHMTTRKIGGWLARSYMRSIYFPMFDHHIANSVYTAAELVPASEGHTTRRGVWVCPMGVEAAQFEPYFGPRSRQLIWAGRIAKEKNLGLLLDTLERLPSEYTLAIAGDGPEKSWLSFEAGRRLPGRVSLSGHIGDRVRFAALLRAGGVFVHPNPREPFGITLLEAMAAGLPVVAPNAGGVLSYANDSNAWLCKPDPASFAAAARSVFEDSLETQHKVRRARKTAESHDWSIIAERFFELLDTLHFEGFRIAQPPLGAAIDAWRALRLQTASR